jgi:hypothetical protein
MLKPEGQYVFILCPNHSGSTVLYFLINTSKEISAMNYDNKLLEGQLIPEVMKFMPYAKESDRGLFYLKKEMHKNEKNYNWQEIKNGWRKHWDYSKSVLVEKSTTNLYRKNILEKNFKNSKFIVMIRNPYAVCEGIKRKHNVDVSYAIDHWIDTADQQIKNISSNSLFFTYEELCEKTYSVVNKILLFIPQLKNLNYKIKLNRPRYEDLIGLENMNKKQIEKLTTEDIKKINEKLKYKLDLLELCGYKLI